MELNLLYHTGAGAGCQGGHCLPLSILIRLSAAVPRIFGGFSI